MTSYREIFLKKLFKKNANMFYDEKLKVNVNIKFQNKK